ncbi:hypothetical protein V5O48_017917 [Marasmius crinis-equi]|uniref:BTB domain-containing protein n=1 Tax=Marasmius crinis-equi TaxID=585013 RepID=A0ABR3EMS1_9AGAR
MSPNDPVSLSTSDSSTTVVADHNGPPKAEQRYAKYPFDDPNSADTVVLSTDNIQFYVYKVILAFVSPYFRDIFQSNPVPPSKLGLNDPEDAEKAIAHLPVHRIEEDSKVFDTILRWVYPGLATPALSSIEDLASVFEAMVKYRMEHTAPFQAATASLLNLATPTPGQANSRTLTVFAIFYRLGASIPKTSMAHIKRLCLHIPLDLLVTGSFPELALIPASALFDLLQFHAKSTSSIRTLVPSFNEWRDDHTSLRYRCSSSSKTGPKQCSVKIVDVKDMHHYLLDQKYPDHPFTATNPIPNGILPELGFSCPICRHPCAAMAKAFGRVIKDEVLDAVESVEEACYVFLPLYQLWLTTCFDRG